MQEIRKIFVIMPFTAANDRDQSALTEFFTTNLKAPIEKEKSLHHKYTVNRSGNEFNMLNNIVSSLREADIVFADLSGDKSPNPNVMYELAIRFSVSRKPVILFREDHPNNRDVFDIGQLHYFKYKVTHLRNLEEYIIERLKTYEINPSEYHSPILQILGGDFSSSREAQRTDVILNLNATIASLLVLQSHLAGAIHLFIVDQDQDLGLSIPNKLDDFRYWFQEQSNQDPIQGFDWNAFAFRFQQLPALANLLVDSSFQDFLPAAVRREINSKLLEFFVEYFGSSIGPYRTSIRVHNIFVDLQNMLGMLSDVAEFISADNEQKKLLVYDKIVSRLKD